MMKVFAGAIFFAAVTAAQSDSDFSGVWKLNPARSEITSMPVPADTFLKVQQSPTAVECSAAPADTGPFTLRSYPLNGKEATSKFGDSVFKTLTKWEGSALLTNTLVSGPRNFTIMERWKRSRDGTTLTIRRTTVGFGGGRESLLVYENTALAAAVPVKRQPAATGRTSESEYLVPAGTKILLSLVNAVSTKTASPGDRVYLETSFPVLAAGRIVIPRGSYVAGTITDAQRPGRVKGKGSLYLRFDSLTLPNGVTRDFRSRLGGIDAENKLDRTEGKINGEGDKGGDARKIGETTAAGASVGSVAGAASGHLGMGAGIGAAAGAAAGLVGVLASRGPDIVLPKGATMEMVLDRDLRFTASELAAPAR